MRTRRYACMGSGSERSFELARQQRTVTDRVNKMYRRIKQLTNGADGSTGAGLNGSLTADGLVRILLRMGVKEKTVIDLGAGDGRVVLAAWLAGADRASGYELPANWPHEYVFQAVCREEQVPTEVHPHAARRRWLPRDTAQQSAVLYRTTTPICRSGRTRGANACTPIELCKEDAQAFSFHLGDIDALERLTGNPHIVFSFWVGMPLATQENILKLAAECSSVQGVAVFRDRKWTSSSDVLDALSDASCSVSSCPTASPSAHLALRCLCCGCSPQASGSSRHRSKCPCTCRASGTRRGRSEDAAGCASQTSFDFSTDLGCASQMHGNNSLPLLC